MKILLKLAISLKNGYFSYIHSYLNYANIAWASTYSTKSKKVYLKQKDAVRIVFNQGKQTKCQWLKCISKTYAKS